MLNLTIVLISHQTPSEVEAMCGMWQTLEPEASLFVAYGGTEENFDRLQCPNRSYVADPRLRTRDHQRERQSYRGVMQTVVESLRDRPVDRILMVECDVVPLKPGLSTWLAQREREENADVLAGRLRRIDGTSHPHYLAHQTHPGFTEWLGASVREDPGVVMMMMGCLTWWKWSAFKATAAAPEPMPVYLELAMATTPHLLGFRVRDLPELFDDLEPLGDLTSQLEQRRAAGRWVLHPCKTVWKVPAS